MRLRQADCGHWITEDAPPVGQTFDSVRGERAVYLCGDCLDAVRRLRVETKEVRPPNGHAKEVEESARGAAAFRAKLSEEDCPYPDRRTREAKEWLRGHREARGAGV